MIGAVVILAVGLVALAVASLVDRRSRLVAEGVLPSRAELATDGPTPVRVGIGDTDLPELPAELASEFDSLWDGSETLPLAVADPRLCTTPGVLWFENALVLACPDEVSGLREVLPACRTAMALERPLAIACTAMDAETIDTLVANRNHGRLNSSVLVGGVDELAALAERVGASLVERPDRQAGTPVEPLLGSAVVLLARDGRALARQA